MSTVKPITINDRKALRLEDVIAKQAQERGLTPLALEPDALLRRVRDGGWSGEYLGQALLSAYCTDRPFNLSLGKINRLDAEGFRLFHQILHIRMIPGWNDHAIWKLAQEIKEILAMESGDVSATDE